MAALWISGRALKEMRPGDRAAQSLDPLAERPCVPRAHRAGQTGPAASSSALALEDDAGSNYVAGLAYVLQKHARELLAETLAAVCSVSRLAPDAIRGLRRGC
eukprot:6016051-Pyramimonas_sp.AAC.1